MPQTVIQEVIRHVGNSGGGGEGAVFFSEILNLGEWKFWEKSCYLPFLQSWKWKMGVWKMTLVSKGGIFLFHDYGRKGTRVSFSEIFALEASR